jgi:purine-binding chemotaxis protein CheW
MNGSDSVAHRIAGLRAEFDKSFTTPLRRHDVEHVELLAIGAGGHPYAVRLSQTSGVHPDRPVTPVPGPVPALLGVAGFSGTIVPVYDLSALLGHPLPDRPRWLILLAGAPPLGLAFHQLDGHLQVPAGTIVAESHPGADCVRGMVPLPGGTRPIVDLPAARAVVHRLAGHAEPDEPDEPPNRPHEERGAA